MAIVKTENEPIMRWTNPEDAGIPKLTVQELGTLSGQANAHAWLEDLGIETVTNTNIVKHTKTKEGKSLPRVFCMGLDENGHDTLRKMDTVGRDASFWEQVQAGNVFVYAEGERHPRQLQVQRGQEGLRVSVSKPVEPAAMPELQAAKPGWFKRTFSFLSRKWQRQVRDYDNATTNRAADQQTRSAKLQELREARTDEELSAEVRNAKEARINEEICGVEYRAIGQAERAAEIMTSVFQPVPKFNESLHKISTGAKYRDKEGLYTKEQFADLKVFSKKEFDLASIRLGDKQSPVSETDFAAVTMSALWLPEMAEKGDDERDIHAAQSLMEVAGLSKDEASALVNASIHSAFWTTDLFIDPPRDNEGAYFKKVTNDGRQMAANAFNAYKAGNKEPLARLIANGVNQAVGDFKGADPDGKLSYHELALCTMIPKLTGLMEKDPELKDLAIQNHGLTEERIQSVKGMETMGKMEQARREGFYRLDREEKVGDQHLSEAEKAGIAKNAIKMKLMKALMINEIAENKEDPKLAQIEQRLMDPSKWVMTSTDQLNAFKADPQGRPAPGEGKIYMQTAVNAQNALNKAMGKDLKTLANLGKAEMERELDTLAEGIVSKYELGKKDAKYLREELDVNQGFKHMNVLKDANEIQQQRKNPEKSAVEKQEPQKQASEAQKTQAKAKTAPSKDQGIGF